MHTAFLTPLKATSLEDIANSLVDTTGDATSTVVAMIKEIIDNTVVPLVLIALLITFLFLIFAFARAKKRQEEDLEDKIKALVICGVVFVVVAGYSFIFGGLLETILGGG